jgi:arylsulfatase A-like enzyme
MIESMDAAVGSLLDAVDRASLADRTVFVFTSDNGGNMYNGIRERDRAGREFVAVPTSNHPLRGGKATVFEGGIRVPAIVAWPGLTAPGTRSDALVQSTDYYPTLLARLGLAAPPHHAIDGIDLTPALRGGPLARPGIFTFFPHHPPVPDWLPASIVVHSGDWKLIRLFHQGERGAHAYRLYHLQDDLGETRDLAAAQPARVRELDALIEAHLRDTRAVVPQPNPAFDPALYQPEIVGIQPGGLKVAGDPAPKANAKAKKK